MNKSVENNTYKVITVNAEKNKLFEVTNFIEKNMSDNNCPKGLLSIIDIVIEEIFINIASYAYQNSDEPGTAEIACGIFDNTIHLIFKDKGIPYNPLEKKDPEIGIPVDKMKIGGLGIYMVKNMVDKIDYKYFDKTNILSIEKHFDVN